MRQRHGRIERRPYGHVKKAVGEIQHQTTKTLIIYYNIYSLFTYIILNFIIIIIIIIILYNIYNYIYITLSSLKVLIKYTSEHQHSASQHFLLLSTVLHAAEFLLFLSALHCLSIVLFFNLCRSLSLLLPLSFLPYTFSVLLCTYITLTLHNAVWTLPPVK